MHISDGHKVLKIRAINTYLGGLLLRQLDSVCNPKAMVQTLVSRPSSFRFLYSSAVSLDAKTRRLYRIPGWIQGIRREARVGLYPHIETGHKIRYFGVFLSCLSTGHAKSTRQVYDRNPCPGLDSSVPTEHNSY